jgi:putative Holliday junction resolvase
MKGRLLGVDYGRVRIGLAISDPDRVLASPLTTYTVRGADADADYFRRLVAEENVVGLVVGLPLHTDGREGVMAAEARTYGQRLADITGLPVEFADERFTSIHAESALWDAGLTHKRRKERRDRVAAQMMLQAYLEGLAATRSGAEGSGNQ